MTDKRMKSKEKERRWTEWNEGVIEMMEWMNEFRNILDYSKIMSSNPEAFFNQTKFFQVRTLRRNRKYLHIISAIQLFLMLVHMNLQIL